MGIRNAGTVIKEARLRAGLTQDQMSEGICSLVSLCNIETGKKGVSPSTFHALMKKAGASGEVYPLFKDNKDFDAYMLLKNVRLYADKYCFNLAYKELMKLKLCSYGENRLYYQESLLLLARVKYLAGDTNYEKLLDILYTSLHISLPNFNLTDINQAFFSTIDYEILTLIANICIDAQKKDTAWDICLSLVNCINKNIVDDKYTAYVRILCLFTYSRLSFIAKDYDKVRENLTLAMHLSAEYYIETYRLEIILLKLLNEYCLDNSLICNDLVYLLSLASHLKCGYVSKLKNLAIELGISQKCINVPDPEISVFTDFPFLISETDLSDGSFDLYDRNTLTIGALIGKFRKEQRLSLNELCEGLCSVSKLSKIETDTQYPGIFLSESLLNRLGYSERDFIFYGNISESEYYRQKSYLLSKYRHGETDSADYKKKLEAGLKSDNVAIRQLCMLLKNSTNRSSTKEYDALIEAIKLSIPNFNLSDFTGKRFSWTEISILNGLCAKMIKLGKKDDAQKTNNMLISYSQNYFITPGFKSISLFPSYRLHFRYLYNSRLYTQIIDELDSFDDELLLKSPETASDFFFYSAQANGELKNFGKMAEQAKIAAGFFILIGQNKRKNYLISEIKKQFGISI